MSKTETEKLFDVVKVLNGLMIGVDGRGDRFFRSFAILSDSDNRLWCVYSCGLGSKVNPREVRWDAPQQTEHSPSCPVTKARHLLMELGIATQEMLDNAEA